MTATSVSSILFYIFHVSFNRLETIIFVATARVNLLYPGAKLTALQPTRRAIGLALLVMVKLRIKELQFSDVVRVPPKELTPKSDIKTEVVYLKCCTLRERNT